MVIPAGFEPATTDGSSLKTDRIQIPLGIFYFGALILDINSPNLLGQQAVKLDSRKTHFVKFA